MNASFDPKTHWEGIYRTKSPTQVSWFKPHLERSLALIEGAGLSRDARILDVGGGASTLVDDLLERGFRSITVLDISSAALAASKGRLGKRANDVRWLESDITRVSLEPGFFDLWHDRAVFHFLTDADDRKKYAEQLQRSVKSEGHVVISTFGLKGPPKCSGLDIVRYSPQTLRQELGDGFDLVESAEEDHATPFGTMQAFIYCHFKRKEETR